ncbi:MAG: PQQ-binding-like beta-propeller repeat protein [candidate division Zixibacteria bacterium]|nr:PQQ-binding-like beta-propeller repeat protein [candidate division Zixibacteria bacterium]
MKKTYQKNFLLFLLVTLLLTSCGRQFHLSVESQQIESKWPFFKGDLSGKSQVSSGSFNGQLDIIWEKNIHDKLTGPITLQHDFIAYPGARKKIKFFNLYDGTYLGRIKSKSFARTGLVTSENIGFFALSPPKNRLEAIDLSNGNSIWKRDLRDAAIGSIIAEGLIIVSSVEGMIYAFHVQDGKLSWKFNCGSRLTTAPIFSEGLLFQTVDNGELIAISVTDGSEVNRTVTENPLVSPAAIGQLVYCADINGFVYGINRSTWKIIWKQHAGGQIWDAPAVSDNTIFVGLSSGEIVALDALTGTINWRFDANEVVSAKPIVVNNILIVGTLRGKVFSLNTNSGKIIDQKEFKGAIKYSPVADGNKIYVATQQGLLISLGDKDGVLNQKDY